MTDKYSLVNPLGGLFNADWELGFHIYKDVEMVAGAYLNDLSVYIRSEKKHVLLESPGISREVLFTFVLFLKKWLLDCCRHDPMLIWPKLSKHCRYMTPHTRVFFNHFVKKWEEELWKKNYLY